MNEIRIISALLCFSLMLSQCGKVNPISQGDEPEKPKEEVVLPTPDPRAKVLYNGIRLPNVWPPKVSYMSELFKGMTPDYLISKPEVIDITMGRQLFVDDFLIAESTLSRQWHQAEYHASNPVLSPEKEWEMSGSEGGGFAAPFSDGVWYDEVDNKFKMWYMGGGNGFQSYVTCYAESSDGINWVRPELNVVKGTNIVLKGTIRDANSVWIDKQTSNPNERFKMFEVSGGAGNWAYHYMTSSDGKSWREQALSGKLADRSTAFYNPFRGIWGFSMRHNVRHSPSELVRARDYQEVVDLKAELRGVKADLQNFWFGPWENEPCHEDYPTIKPAIYNLDAIAYESLMLGIFSVWSGPENDICDENNLIKRNQLLLGFSRDGWSWHREDFIPFCPVNSNLAAWNNGNIQSAIGSPIIVGDKLYFYMSGRKLHNNNQSAEIASTALATLRRDGFASMSGTGYLITEPLVFTGEKLYVNVQVSGKLYVELLDKNGSVISGFSKDDCIPFVGDSVKSEIKWENNSSLISLKGKTIRVKFYLENGDLYSFWISQFNNGKSYGYTAGGGLGLSKYGIDI